MKQLKTMSENKKTLLFGIGNCGRSDDGLGWTFLDKIQEQLPNNYDIEYRYQLQVEDAELASHYDAVHFIDAHSQKLEKGFIWKKCIPKAVNSYTSHELEPETVLYLTKSIYNKEPLSYIMGITGENYSLNIGLSKNAEINLSKALKFFSTKILTQNSIIPPT